MAFFSLLILLFCPRIANSVPVDYISPGLSLTGNQTIVSKSGIFELGFFTPKHSEFYHIGIWYRNITIQTMVWVARTDYDSIRDPSLSEFKISEEGNLVLLNQFKDEVWSTKIYSNYSSTMAVLLDSGNLVLTDGSDSSSIIWQSFHDPIEPFNGSFYHFLQHQKIQKNSTEGRSTYQFAGALSGILILSVIVSMSMWRCRRRHAIDESEAGEGSLVVYKYRDLKKATKKFSKKLGGGSFGSVFKGALPNSTSIAVKRLEGFRQGEKQFRSEVSTIGIIQHVNLLHLRGFCSEGTKKLLVYDYMKYGSLDNHLFHQKGCEFLNWKTRFQIAIGAAKGLAYLHEECRECIIHCDIKPENILLDVDFQPKVADFGMAKLLGREFSRVLTTMRGTIGYLAPEWISGSAITPKADVYSYGMMLLEIVSGRRNTSKFEGGNVGYFPVWAAAQLNEGEVLSLLDCRLEGNADLEELTRACKVACWCIQDDEAHRPSMGKVVRILEGVVEVNIPPISTRLLNLTGDQEDTVFFLDSLSDKSTESHRCGEHSIVTIVDHERDLGGS